MKISREFKKNLNFFWAIILKDWYFFIKSPVGQLLCSLLFLYSSFMFFILFKSFNEFIQDNIFINKMNITIYSGIISPYYKNMIFFLMLYFPLLGTRFFSKEINDSIWYTENPQITKWIWFRFLSFFLFFIIFIFYIFILPYSVLSYIKWDVSIYMLFPYLILTISFTLFYSMLCVLWLYQENHIYLKAAGFFFSGLLLYSADQFFIKYLDIVGFSMRIERALDGVIEINDLFYFLFWTFLFYEWAKLKITLRIPFP